MKTSWLEAVTPTTRWLSLFALLMGLYGLFGALFSSAEAEKRSESAVSARLNTFLKAYLHRPLSSNELSRVTQEFLGYYGGTCDNRCEKTLGDLEKLQAQISAAPDQPENILARHSLTSICYFDPKLKGTLILRLLTEPDPVRVTDPKSRRLMTEKDVAAMVHMLIFHRSKSDTPTERHQLTPGELGKIAGSLNQSFGAQSRERQLPMTFPLAAELWAGIKREWPLLSSGERRAVLDYIAHGALDHALSAELYHRLMGMALADADRFRTQDKLAAVSLNIQGKFFRLWELQNDAAVIDMIGKWTAQTYP